VKILRCRSATCLSFRRRSTASSAAPAQNVDVAAIVDKAAAAKGEKLEWRTSIVDLMTALDIDSSLSARKELAHELGYTASSRAFLRLQCPGHRLARGEAGR
jgi:hypothetical protein